MPSPADAGRAIKVAGAGFGTVAALGFAFGGPVGWALGGVVGLAVSAIVDHAADRADTRDELNGCVSRLANDSFASFERNVRDAIMRSGGGLDRRVSDRMVPFLNDMEHRLEAIRKPNADELMLHEQVREITGAALENLVRILGDRVQPTVTSSQETGPKRG